MEKLREEVLVEIYLKHKNIVYVRGMEYTSGEKNESIEWHEILDNGNWELVKDIEFYKELEKIYIKTFIDE